MLFNIIPAQLVAKTNESELVVFFKNGSLYQLKGADDPDALRGAGPMGMIFDEFDTMKAEAWGVMEPVIRANGGWCWFIGTPKGKQNLYKFYHRGQKDSKEWSSYLLRASESGIIPPDQLEAAKESMSQSLYNQEFQCEFLEGEGKVFRNVRAVCVSTPRAPDPRHSYVMGVDLAKVQDYTVIAVYDRNLNEQVYQDRFKTLEWPFQKRRIKAISAQYNNALTVIDATGLGDPVADDLARDNVPVEPFKITETSKKELVEKLSIYIEQQAIKMINMEETLMEFDNFGYEIGPTGKIRYGAPEGFNDDIVIAHALAVSSLQSLFPMTRLAILKTPIQRELERAKKDYDNQNNEGWREWESVE